MTGRTIIGLPNPARYSLVSIQPVNPAKPAKPIGKVRQYGRCWRACDLNGRELSETLYSTKALAAQHVRLNYKEGA